MAIGIITLVTGTVEAVDTNGNTRTLSVGDGISNNETVRTLSGASVAITMDSGQVVTLGGNQTLVFNQELLDEMNAGTAQPAVPVAVEESTDDDIEAIQAALLAGEDISELEATAAGPTAGGADSEGSSFVILDRSGQRTTPDAGFNTDPISVAFDPAAPEDPFLEDEAVVETLPAVSVSGSSELEGGTGFRFKQALQFEGEGEQEPNYLSYTFTLSEPSDVPVDVTFDIVEGTAGPTDVALSTGNVVTFAPGETSITIGIPIVGDLLLENNETVDLIITDVTNATVDVEEATSTIIDDDSAQISLYSYPQQTAEEDEADVYYYLYLEGGEIDAGQTVTVDVTVGGTATQGGDIESVSAALQAAADGTAGVSFDGTTLTFDSDFSGFLQWNAQVLNDTLAEDSETVTVTLSNVVSSVGPVTLGNAGVETIITDVDNNVTLDLTVDVDAISEEGEETATYTLSTGGFPLSAVNTVTVAVIVGGDATGNADYQDTILAALADSLPPGVTLDGNVLTFGPTYDGSDIVFSVDAIDDSLLDDGELITVDLATPTITYGTVDAVGDTEVEITDVDDSVVFSIVDTQDSISEEAEETNEYTLSVEGFPLHTGNEATVLVTVGGTAGASDYTPAVLTALAAALPLGVALAGNTLVFSDVYDGSDITFDISAINDQLLDNNETITVDLSAPTVTNGVASIGDGDTDVIITDLDQELVWDSVGSEPVLEEGNDSLSFQVKLAGGPLTAGQSTSVDIAFGGDADAGIDYVDIDGTLTSLDSLSGIGWDGTTLTIDDAFGPFNSLTIFLAAAPIDDSTPEGLESVTMTLSNPQIVNGTVSILNAVAESGIYDLDNAVTFDLSVDVEAISEEAEETATYTLSTSGMPLNVGNSATATLQLGGDALNASDYTAMYAALDAALPTGVTRSGDVLTFTSDYDGSDITWNVSAIDDSAVEGVEDITLDIISSTIAHGTVSHTGDTDVDIRDHDIEAEGDSVIVDEDDLSNGTDQSDNTIVPATISLLIAGGLSSVTFAGQEVVVNGDIAPQTLTMADGNKIHIVEYDAIAGTIDVNYELVDNTLDHNVQGEDTVGASYPVVITDIDGDFVSVDLDVTIVDDVPEVVCVQHGLMTGATPSMSGELVFNFGADGPHAIDPIALDMLGVHPFTLETSQTSEGATLVGSIDGVDVFSLTVNVDGTYDFNLIEEQVTTTETLFIGLIDSGSYPGSYVITEQDGIPLQNVITISGDDPTDSVNVSGAGIGINNNHINVDDPMYISWAQDITSTELTFSRWDANNQPGGRSDVIESVDFIVMKDGVPIATGILQPNTVPSGNITFTIDDTFNFTTGGITGTFDQIIISSHDHPGVNNSNEKVDLISIQSEQTTLVADIDLSFTVTGKDGDDDTVTTQLDIDVNADGNVQLGFDLEYDGGPLSIAGSDGYDTLMVEGDVNFEDDKSTFVNIEEISMINDTDDSIVLTTEDVLGNNGSVPILITGDEDDSVTLIGNWAPNAALPDVIGFVGYSDNGANLYIQTGITVTTDTEA
jgi:hypothetical protein